MYLKIS